MEELSLQHGDEVEDGDVLHPGVADGGDVVVGHVPGGEGAVKGAVLVGHGEDGEVPPLHGLPAPADGGGGGESGGRVVVQVPDLGAHVVDELGGLEAEAVQDNLGLVADLAQPGGLVLPVSQGVLEGGVGHGGDDGVRIRVPVPGDINGIHGEEAPFAFYVPLCFAGGEMSIFKRSGRRFFRKNPGNLLKSSCIGKPAVV